MVEMMLERELDPISIQITSGYDVTQVHGSQWRVPKRHLVTAMQMVIQSDRLQVADRLPFAQVFLSEAREFQLKQKDSGALTFAASKDSVHDDLVLAVAMGLWFGESVIGDVPTPGKKPSARQVRGIGLPARLRRQPEGV